MKPNVEGGGDKILWHQLIPHKLQMDYLNLKSGTWGAHTARHVNMNGVWRARRINQQSHALQSAVT